MDEEMLFGSWVHSHEEDDGDTQVFRPADVILATRVHAARSRTGPSGSSRSVAARHCVRGVRRSRSSCTWCTSAGTVELDGRELGSYGPKELARRLGLLPQSPNAPDGISVSDLVARGRYPHQSLFKQWSTADEEAVVEAMAAADVTGLADRTVEELSGGQRQRVWLAMALAQQTPLLLLDEPTTYLDLPHQLEVLELARRLVEGGRTVVAVLHELNLAFRYADHLIVMAEGDVVAAGPPRQIVTAALLEQVYDMPCRIITDPVTGSPLVVPEVPR